MRDGRRQGREFGRDFVMLMPPAERAAKVPGLRRNSLAAARSAERRGDRYAVEFNLGLAEALGSPRAPSRALVAAGFPRTSPSPALVAAGFPRTSPSPALVAAGFPRSSPSAALVAAGFPRASPSRASRASRASRRSRVPHKSAGSWSAVRGEILPPRRRTRRRAKAVKKRPRRRA